MLIARQQGDTQMHITPMSIIETLPFTIDAGLGTRARLGAIILQTDQTIEHEFATLLRCDGVALYHARMPNEMEVTPETLLQMARDLPAAAALLPRRFAFDAIAYCCTSGATMIGEDRVDSMIRQCHPDAVITDPLRAFMAALEALGIKRIGLLTPYAPEVTTQMQNRLLQAGFRISALASFNQSDDFSVARISSDSILEGILALGRRDDCDAVCVSCTSLRVLPVIARAERLLGKPVLSSNQVSAWHLLRLAQVRDRIDVAGRLFQV